LDLASLLVDIEQQLRAVFVDCNNCTERLLTAVSSEYFTTLDVMLEPEFNGSVNQLFACLPLSSLFLLYDLFQHPKVLALLEQAIAHKQLTWLGSRGLVFVTAAVMASYVTSQSPRQPS
jgi:hypothetical protein